MKHSLNYIPFDVFTLLLQYLDLRDSHHFIVSCKHIYSEYQMNKRWVDTYLTRKIYRYFGFSLDQLLVTPGLIRDCFSLYNHFKNHQHSDRVDFIFYIIEKDLQSLHLFQSILSDCVFRETTPLTTLHRFSSMQTLYTDPSTSHVISSHDLQYILTYCTPEQLQVIFRKFTIPCETLADTVDDLVNRSHPYQKLKMYIDYMLYKHYFNGRFSCDMDRNYFNYACIHFMKRNDRKNLQYLLVKCDKYKANVLDYQPLVNKCIEMEDTENLDLLIDHLNRYNQQAVHKSYIIIPQHYITTLSRRHSFDYLRFLIDNYIGSNINTMAYLYSIYHGLLIKSGQKNIKYISEQLSRFLTSKNVEIICGYLTNPDTTITWKDDLKK